MAMILFMFPAPLITILITFSSILNIKATTHPFPPFIMQQVPGLGEEKVSHLHFYFHDTIAGPRPTCFKIVEGPSSTTDFGDLYVIDDPLTEGPEATSKMVGRAQGLYMQASQEQIVLLMAMNLVFTHGEHNGSTIAVMGRNSVMSPVREMPVVGGSGVFRLARGYALAKTHMLNATVAIVEYDVYVVHYSSQMLN